MAKRKGTLSAGDGVLSANHTMTEWNSPGDAQLSEMPASLADIWNRALLRRSQQLDSAQSTHQSAPTDSISLQAEVAALFGEEDALCFGLAEHGEFGPG